MLVFRWQKKFQDGFTNLKDGSHPDQPKTVVTKTNIAAVAKCQTFSEIYCS